MHLLQPRCCPLPRNPRPLDVQTSRRLDVAHASPSADSTRYPGTDQRPPSVAAPPLEQHGRLPPQVAAALALAVCGEHQPGPPRHPPQEHEHHGRQQRRGHVGGSQGHLGRAAARGGATLAVAAAVAIARAPQPGAPPLETRDAVPRAQPGALAVHGRQQQHAAQRLRALQQLQRRQERSHGRRACAGVAPGERAGQLQVAHAPRERGPEQAHKW